MIINEYSNNSNNNKYQSQNGKLLWTKKIIGSTYFFGLKLEL